MRRFRQVTIIGLGLMGGSLGMAIRRRRLARVVIGYSRKPKTLRRAKRRGAVDIGTTDLKTAVRHADLVVLATPVDTVVPLARRAARFMPAGGVLTDVGSTKAAIVRACERRPSRGIAFIGAHPLAGSEQRGIDAADAHLFDGSICVLTSTRQTNRQALGRVKRLWAALGCRVVVMSPAQHDRLLAATSHLPHALAYCLAGAVTADALPQAPRSFLDMTRIAKSEPALWDDILVTNQRALLAAMDRFERRWRSLRRSVSRRDRAALRRFLAAAKSRRDALKDL